MNYKVFLLTFILLTCAQLHCAERPPQPPASKKLPTFGQMFEHEEKQNKAMRERLSTLPRELQQDILNRYFFSAYPNINEIAKRIIALKDKITVAGMLQFFNALPYTANAITIATRLQNNPNTLPLMQEPRIIAWLEHAQKRLKGGQELYDKVKNRFTLRSTLKDLFNNKDIDLNWRDEYDQASLDAAIVNNYIKATLLLLNAGADPDTPLPNYGSTILHRASDYGSTILDRAADLGHQEIVRILLLAGANPNLKDAEMGRTLLIYAAKNNHTHTELVKLLLEFGTKLDLQDNKGKTALMYAAKKGHSAIVRLLLEFGAALDLQDNDGKTALVYAARKGHAQIVRLLLEAGANPDLKDNDDNTAIILAAYHFKRDVVETLLQASADPNLKGSHGQTALMMATVFDNIEIVKALLKAGANPDLQDDNGRTALMLAPSEEMAKLLEDASILRKQKSKPKENPAPGCAIS